MNNLLLSASALTITLIVVFGATLIAFIVVLLVLTPLKIWYKSQSNDCGISMTKLISLKQRNKDDLNFLIDTYITAQKSGIFIDIDELEAFKKSGGHIDSVVDALILARSSGLELSVDTAKTIDLSGRNVKDIVKSCLAPKIMQTSAITGIAKDNIELKTFAIITYKTKIEEVIGFANEETILAKISEAVSDCISGFNDFNEVLTNKEIISKMVFAKHFEKNSPFEILSIELGNIEISKDIGSLFRTSVIEEERLKANALAEERRLIAIAKEQEMKVKAEEIKNEKIRYEMEISKTLSERFKNGEIDLIDYYKIQNMIADTNMRKSFTVEKSEDKNNYLNRYNKMGSFDDE